MQHAFAAAVAALGKPTAVVLLHGGAIDTTAERDAAGIGAIVDAFYPGTRGADAIASTLFGDNERLGGKMAFTTYPADYVDAIAMSEMELDVGPGRGYRFYSGAPVYPFGFGLALTTFTTTLASGPRSATLATEAAPSTTLSYAVLVTNTGARAGDTVVQAYFAPRATPAQPASRLRRQLFDYARVHLAPGASATLTFAVDSATLRLADRASGDEVSTPGTFDVVFSDGVAAAATVEVVVTGAEVVARRFPW